VRHQTAWQYRGMMVYPADMNSSGIRWICRTVTTQCPLRSDTKEGMRELIRIYLGNTGV